MNLSSCPLLGEEEGKSCLCWGDVLQKRSNPFDELEDQRILRQLQVPIPVHEHERLQVLRETEVLDTAAEERFDRYTSLAKRYFHVPIVLVSLVDLSRQWFKSSVGLDSFRETHRDLAFCSYTVLEATPNVFVVPNAEEDDRFKNNDLVTGPSHIRFYAGACIRVAGFKVGSLCLIDTNPRHDFTTKDESILLELADMVAKLLEERRRGVLHVEEELAKMALSVMFVLKQPLLALNDCRNTLQQLTQTLLLTNKDDKITMQTTTSQMQSTIRDLQIRSHTFMSILDLSLRIVHRVMSGSGSSTPGGGNAGYHRCELAEVHKQVQHVLSQMHPPRQIPASLSTALLQVEHTLKDQLYELWVFEEVLILALIDSLSQWTQSLLESPASCMIKLTEEPIAWKREDASVRFKRAGLLSVCLTFKGVIDPLQINVLTFILKSCEGQLCVQRREGFTDIEVLFPCWVVQHQSSQETMNLIRTPSGVNILLDKLQQAWSQAVDFVLQHRPTLSVSSSKVHPFEEVALFNVSV